MIFSLRQRATIALTAFAFFACAAQAEKLRIASTPPGAKVEINGVKGRNYGQYWLFKTDHFEVKLDSRARALTKSP